LRLKLTYLRPDWRVPLQPDVAAIRSLMRTDEAQGFFLDQAGRSVTIVADEGLPLNPETAGRVLLVGNDPEFIRSGRRAFPGADTMRFQDRAFYSSSRNDRRRFAAAARRYDTVIFLLSDPGSMQILQAGADSAEAITVYSILTPIYFSELPWVTRGIAAYGWGRESYESGFSAMLGQIPAPGRLPISAPRTP
ncbi:MAG TPA: glycoside hydrolase family 3 protein, partial [Alkalispirochaeta sp.]|nr:glycoside hydrolase family 3 protein [Alkalispirochaeta sp.]